MRQLPSRETGSHSSPNRSRKLEPHLEPVTSASRKALIARRHAALAAVVVLASMGTPGAAHSQAPGASQNGRIIAVEFRGVSNVSRDDLASGLATVPSECRNVLYTPICWVTRSPIFTVRRYLDPLVLRRDVLRIRLYYWRRGYRDAAVTSRTERAKDGVRVIFDIEEREPTIMQTLDVQQPDSVLPPRVLRRRLRLRAGEPLDLVAMDSSIALLRDALWDRGYPDATIELDTTRISNALNSGPVTLLLRPGPQTTVDSISIEGNKQVSDRTIRRLLNFRPGDLFRRSEVLGSQRNLYLSGLFSEVEMQAAPRGDSGRVVQLRVTESELHRLDLRSGFTTADFVQLEAEFVRYNFFGSARRFTVRGTVSNILAAQLNGAGIFYDVTNGAQGEARDPYLSPTWATSVEFTQPWFLSPRNQLGASVFSHRRNVPGIVIDRGLGLTGAFTRNFGPQTNSTLGYTYESSSIEASDVYFCVSFGVCVPSTISAIAGRNPLAPVSLVTQIDQTNDPFTPDRGFRVRIDLEHASAATLSDFRFNRASLTGSTYYRFSRRFVAAGRLRFSRVGALRSTNEALRSGGTEAEPILHPRKRFYAGGSQSVRGYGENQLGPRVLTISPTVLTDTKLANPCTDQSIRDLSCDPNGVEVSLFHPQPLGGTSLAEASVELRFPLLRSRGLMGAVFVDGAVVGTDRFSDVLGATAAITPGFGVRLDTPVGPVRLDLGIRPQLVEQLPVITQVDNPDGSVQLVTLNTTRRYDPVRGSGNWLQQVLGRLTLHLAIGPAF